MRRAFFTAALLFSGVARAQTPEAPAPLVKCIAHAECPGRQVCIQNVCADPPGAPQAGAPTAGPAPAAPPVDSVAAPPPPSPPAAAAEPAPAEKPSWFFLSSERLTSGTYWMVSVAENGTDRGTRSGLSVALLFGTTNPDAIPAFAYQVPRLGFDFRVAEHLTVGTAAGVFVGTLTVPKDEKNPSVTLDGPSLTMFLFAPRVGYMADLSSSFGLWGRAGLTYYNFSQSDKSSSGVSKSTSMSGGAVTAEGFLLLKPYTHWALFGGVVADFGFTGGRSVDPAPTNPTDIKVVATAIGFSGGGMVSF